MRELGAGTMVTPNLRLVKLLGEGAMGSVWIAEHLGLDTRVAVKFISHTRPKDRPALVARFEREARAAARIKSPHVVQVHDHGVMEGDTPYIVMELLEGETLGGRLRRGGPLTLEELGRVVTHVARALHKAHALGIVHRDIKPDNIFLVRTEDEPIVKVLDFGIAKHVEQPGETMTQTGALLGTPLYMSPERIKSARDADHRADLWALAVVAYEALTGKPPFSGETVGALFFSICGDAVDPPSALREGVPSELDAWFSRALRAEPEKRFDSARAMAAAFRTAVGAVGDDGLGDTQVTTRPAAEDDDAADAAALETGEFVSREQLEIAATQAAEPTPARSEAPAETGGDAEPGTLEGTAGRDGEPAPRAARRSRGLWAAALAMGAAAAAAVVTLGDREDPPLELSSRVAALPEIAFSAAPSAPPVRRLSQSDIATVMRTRNADYRRCYEAARKRAPGLRGTLNVALVLDEAGAPRNAIVGGMGNTDLHRCVRDAVLELRFPAPGRETEVSYPIDLQPHPIARAPTANKKKAPAPPQSNVGNAVSLPSLNAPPVQQQAIEQQQSFEQRDFSSPK